MNTNQDQKWQSLLSLSAPTFAGETSPPYGFVTRTLTRLKSEKREQELFERIGLRAIFAALGTLAITAVVSLDVHQHSKSDSDPGVNNLVQAENLMDS